MAVCRVSSGRTVECGIVIANTRIRFIHSLTLSLTLNQGSPAERLAAAYSTSLISEACSKRKPPAAACTHPLALATTSLDLFPARARNISFFSYLVHLPRSWPFKTSTALLLATHKSHVHLHLLGATLKHTEGLGAHDPKSSLVHALVTVRTYSTFSSTSRILVPKYSSLLEPPLRSVGGSMMCRCTCRSVADLSGEGEPPNLVLDFFLPGGGSTPGCGCGRG